MHCRRVCHQSNSPHLPAKGQIEAFDDGIQLSHVYVLDVIRAQPRRVFHDRAADFQRYADCQRAGVYPNFGFLRRNVPSPARRVTLLHRQRGLLVQLSQLVSVDHLIPASCGVVSLSFDVRRRYSQPSADREVANQLSAVRKHRATGQHVWHPAHVVVSPPHQLPSLPPDLQSKEAGSVSGTLVGFARQSIVRQVSLHAVHSDDAFVHQDVVDVRRGSFPDIRIPGEHAVQHGFHHQWCDIQAESQSGQAVTLAFEDHRLIWPQGFVDADLQVGLFQVDQGHVDPLSAPLAQLLAAHVRVGSVALNVGVQLPEVHHGPDLLLVSLDHCHQWQQPFGRAVFALVVRHEPPVFDPLPELVFIRATCNVRRRVLFHCISQDAGLPGV
ncbi:hypothetical protein T01_8910 [Trichinella spiralis]|uniref:Uncharacterized protein n=1 Tax=Trichinella spiralis TaxID=6334 RepID=A0A0V1ASG2_TRISP|nr:hypothetical protein T01_8910 [Trichinella spiralis]